MHRASFVSLSCRAALLGASAALSACGVGTVAAVSGDNNGTSGNSPTALSAVLLEDADSSPARIRFTLSDTEYTPARIILAYHFTASDGVPHGPLPVTRLIDTDPDHAPLTWEMCGEEQCVVLPTAPGGIQYELDWDFSLEPDLPADGSLVLGFRLEVSVIGGLQQTIGPGLLGNDPPRTAAGTPQAMEMSGIVPLRFSVADSSGDTVDVRVEFIELDADTPAWKPARPAGESETPEFAFQGIQAPPQPLDLIFFWDTDIDLAAREGDVKLRFTATDRIVTGTSDETSAFRIDNNEEPVAAIKAGLVIANPDRRRGIALPFEVRDREHDDVRLVIQWTRLGEPFVDLPLENEALQEVLDGAQQRRAFRVCSEFPRFVGGGIVPIDALHVRLPELGNSAAAILADRPQSPLVGLQLDWLRASSLPSSLAKGWDANPLVSPRAALPLDDGSRALVLEDTGADTWHLSEIDLVSGLALGVVASGGGAPTSMAFEQGQAAVLVASATGSSWRVHRVQLGTGAVTALLDDGGAGLGAIRDLKSLGTNAALATVGDRVLRLGFVPPRAVPVASDLATPWGLVLDQQHPNLVYIAERDAGQGRGRVLRLRLDTLETSVLRVTPEVPGGEGLVRPTLLALERTGTMLLAVCATDADPTLRELCTIDLRAADPHLVGRLPLSVNGRLEGTTSLATGPDGLRLLALQDQSDLAAGGGLVQSRTIAAYDPATCTVEVTPPFDALPRGNDRWRIGHSFGPIRASATGTSGTFIWDSADALGGSVMFRATPIDREAGSADQTSASKRVFTPFESNVVTLGGFGESSQPVVTRVADIDGDGDQDVLALYAGLSSIFIYLQEAPREFSAPLALGGCGPAPTTPCFFAPVDLVVEDLDRDGRLDLAVAGRASSNLVVLLQTAPLSFVAQELSGGLVTAGAAGVAAGDVDSDGDLDLVLASKIAGTVSVFRQVQPGLFEPFPSIVLGGPTSTPNAFFPVVADLDGDGDLDLAAAGFCDVGPLACAPGTETPFVYVFINEQGFGAADVLPLAIPGPGLSFMQAMDINADGDLDLVVAGSSSKSIALFEQDGLGSFAAPRFLGGPTSNDDIFAFDTADLDQDGDLDLAAANGDSSNLLGFFQEAPGLIASAPEELTVPQFSLFTVSVTANDVDGDGTPDLVSANAFSGDVSVFFRARPGTFRDIPTLALGFDGGGALAESVQAADLDADGDLDVLSANSDSSDLRVYFQIEPGVFDPVPLVLGEEEFGSPNQAFATDVNGDGLLDVVACYEAPGALYVYMQDPSTRGSFFPGLRLGGPTLTAGTRAGAACDVDGDGDLDLVAGNTGLGLTVFYQSPLGTFDRTLSVPGAPRVESIAAADLDGDGDLDLAVADRDEDQLLVFLQADGGFSDAPLRLGGAGLTEDPWQVLAVDLDADGKLDLISANEGSDNLTLFVQTGPGTFATDPLVLGGPGLTGGVRSLSVADIDFDGDLDVASANLADNTLTLFRQARPGVFERSPLIMGEDQPGVAQPMWVELVDLDGEGDIDILFGGVFPIVFWGTHGVD